LGAVKELAADLGKVPYFIQKSGQNIANGDEGCASIVWDKDVRREAEDLSPPAHALIVVIDTVDYFELNDLLLWQLPMVVFGVAPSRAAANEAEYSYTFLSDGSLQYQVLGGAKYRQAVWNLSGDTAAAVWPSHYGFGVTKSIFFVDRRQVAIDHQLTLFTPVATYSFPMLDWAPYLGTRNKKLNPIVKLGRPSVAYALMYV